MAIFNRGRKPGEEEDQPGIDGEAELELPAKPTSRPGVVGAIPTRPAVVVPPARPGDAHPAEPRGPESRGAEPRPAETKSEAKLEPKAMEGRTVDTTRPVADMPRRMADSTQSRPEELRKLTVGREISLQGEITHCDHLVVEGSVTANLSGCHQVEIMESGVFKGSVDIDQIEVRGLFEGTMTVSGRLAIRATGRVVGTVQYGQIEIEPGGQISGEVQAQSQQPLQLPAAPRNAAKQPQVAMPAVAAAMA